MSYEYVSGQIVNEEDTEIKLVALDNIFLVQISSGTIRGMLAVQNDVSEEELSDLGKMISDLMESYFSPGSAKAN